MIAVAVVALPALGAALGLVFALFPRLRPYHWAPDAIGSGLAAALALALVAGAGREEALFGAWLPVSTLGELLLMRPDAPGAAVVAALAVAQLSGALTRRAASWPRIMAAAVFGALVLGALSGSLIGLMAGLGLADVFAATRRLMRGEDAGRVASDALISVVSMAFVTMAAASLVSADGSLYYPLARLSARQSGFLGAAVLLRFAAVLARDESAGRPDRVRPDPDVWAAFAMPLGGLILLMRLPQLGAPALPDWVVVVGFGAGLIQLVRAGLEPQDASSARRALGGVLGVGIVAASAWQTPPLAAAASAFVLGSGLVWRRYQELLATPTTQIAALVAVGWGAACLAGAPLTPGFIARAGAIDALASRAGVVGGVLLAAGWAAAHAMLVVFGLRSVSEVRGQRPEGRLHRAWPMAAIAVPALVILALGVLPPLLGGNLGASLAATGLTGWISWILGIAAGFGLWALRGRIPAAARSASASLYATLSLRWLTGPLAGALDRLSAPLTSLFVTLESDGALLWTIGLALAAVLIGRSPGP